MSKWNQHELSYFAALLLQNEQSFVVRRFIQRFLAGELTAAEAVARVLRCPGVRYEASDSFDHPKSEFDRARAEVFEQLAFFKAGGVHLPGAVQGTRHRP